MARAPGDGAPVRPPSSSNTRPTPSKEESEQSKSASEQEDTAETSEGESEKIGLMSCMLVLTLFTMIVFVVMTLNYGAQRRPVSTGPPGHEVTKGRPAGSYWVKFAMHPTAESFPWMKGCSTPACLAIRHRLLGAIEPFMNPCRNLNFFSCSVADRRSLVEQEENAEEASGGTDTWVPSFRAPQILARGRAPRIRAGGQPLRDIMIHTCYMYSESLRDSLEVVQKTTQYFNLYYPNVVPDPNEDPIARMMQLSLEYGLHPIVSFVRRFRYTRDPSEPFDLQIDITERAKHYFRYWSGRLSAGFYNKTLVPLGQKPEDKDDLTVGDMLISEIVKEEVDPVTNETHEGVLEAMKIAELANYTEEDMTADRWKELLVLYGRSKFELRDIVFANRRALAVLGHFARSNESTAMRRMLAFHLGLLLLDPKDSITKESVCKKYADEALIFPGGVMPITLTEFEIPVERLRKVAIMMASIMDTLVAITREAGNVRQNRKDLGLALDYPASAKKKDSVYLLDGVDGTEHHYLYVWLRELRIRHAQPPLVQAALESMSLAGDRPLRLYQRFRPPYFYEDGLTAYNYATLGQILAQGAVAEMSSGTSPSMEAAKARWRTFWNKRAATDFNAAYCLQATRRKGFMEHPVAPLNESAESGVPLQRVMGARLAYLAWRRLPGSGSHGLPKLYLAPKVLFFVQHCILGCARMGSMGTDMPDDGCAVLMRDWGSIAESIQCKREQLYLPMQRCRYI
ncbi:hypothetical protein HPB50_004147 [Hyalomma asiaticum]|uniref:Uncharacterized protein n=1 Tax=Hyalomma asiaticum TaxID=266040 RepID=A0ACB7SHY4_HYAAI|nr:hypothetical protein HPB50_004147 [Hyalomma asiaticum]